MAQKPRPAIVDRLMVSIDVEGKPYTGSCTVYDDGWIKVMAADGRKRVKLDESSPNDLATRMLHEIAAEALRRARRD
jgi:hypothetical protein